MGCVAGRRNLRGIFGGMKVTLREEWSGVEKAIELPCRPAVGDLIADPQGGSWWVCVVRYEPLEPPDSGFEAVALVRHLAG